MKYKEYFNINKPQSKIAELFTNPENNMVSVLAESWSMQQR